MNTTSTQKKRWSLFSVLSGAYMTLFSVIFLLVLFIAGMRNYKSNKRAFCEQGYQQANQTSTIVENYLTQTWNNANALAHTTALMQEREYTDTIYLRTWIGKQIMLNPWFIFCGINGTNRIFPDIVEEVKLQQNLSDSAYLITGWARTPKGITPRAFASHSKQTEHYFVSDDLRYHTRPYYYLLRDDPSRLGTISDIYEDAIEGRSFYCFTVAAPIWIKTQFLGVALIDVGYDQMLEQVRENLSTLQEGSLITVINPRGQIILHSETEKVGTPFATDSELDAFFQSINSEKNFTTQYTADDGAVYLRTVSPFTIDITGEQYASIVDIPMAHIHRALTRLFWQFILQAVVALILFFITSMAVAKRIVRPLRNTVERVIKLGAGDVREQFRERTNIKETAALDHNIESLRTTLYTQVQQLHELNQTLNGASATLVQSSNAIAAGSEESSASAEEVNASLDSLSSNATQNATRAEQAIDSMDHTEKLLNNLRERIASLSSFMAKVGVQVAQVMDIARQTNLLALNAAVEAARAGVYGRGFAVVANEVGKLAEDSQQVAAEIFTFAEQAKELTQVAHQDVEELHPAQQQAWQQVIVTARSAQEDSIMISQIAQAMNLVSSQVSTFTAQSSEIAQSAEQLKQLAEDINRQVQFFTK